MKSVVTDQPQTADKIVVESVVDYDKIFDSTREWPFSHFCDDLCHDLFEYVTTPISMACTHCYCSPNWTIRHGAGIGLREILKRHAQGAGKTADAPESEMANQNSACLNDIVVRLLCVFALDRFGDFVGDQVT